MLLSGLASSLEITVSSFVAIDFETANHRRNSACAVGLTAVRCGRIEVTRSFLIRPPDAQLAFTGIHGLRWQDVRASPTFGELWPTLQAWIDNAEFIAAHNAPFDSSPPRMLRHVWYPGASGSVHLYGPGLPAPSGESTRLGYPMFAVDFGSRYVTTTLVPTRKRVRASYWLRRLMAGSAPTVLLSHDTA